MILGIIANTRKSECRAILPGFLEWLTRQGARYVADESLKDLLGSLPYAYYPRDELAGNCNVALSFGGDGTMLSTARAVGVNETPILGVNMGGMGYLTDISPDELKDKIRDFLAGMYTIENRMLLKTTVEINGEVNTYHALNDVVIDKGAVSRIITIRTTIDGEYFNTYYADGIIIATPTGSTGYSLSAGGPIIEPSMEGIIINPICPHTLGHRPIVISADKSIEIQADPQLREQVFACDGFLEKLIPPGTRVTVEKSERVVRLIIMKGRHFYHVLREKLNWGI